MRIDAHQHFWMMKERLGSWPPQELAAIYRDFEPNDLKPILQNAGVDGTVLVQTMPNLDDTRFMLDLAAHNAFILGVVGWVDMKAADAPDVINRLAESPQFCSVRPMLQDIAETGWIDDESLKPAVDALCANKLTFDALVTPRHFEPLLAFARRFSDLPIVIDHGAKPLIAEGKYVLWRKYMSALADLPNVYCKLSGLLIEAGNQKPEAVRPYAETILELFGAKRTIWGSDWPVVRLVGKYEDWLAQCLDIVPPQDHLDVFGRTATKFYRLDVIAAENRGVK